MNNRNPDEPVRSLLYRVCVFTFGRFGTMFFASLPLSVESCGSRSPTRSSERYARAQVSATRAA